MQVNLPVNSWPLARRGENARLVVLVVPAVLAALSLSPAWDSQPVLSLANWIAIVMFAMAASLLADEDGQRGTGKLFLAAAGCLVLLTVGDTFRVGPIPAVAWVVGPLVFPILAVVSLRYPDPRLTNRAHRTFVAVEVAHLVVLRTLIGLTSTRESLALPSGAWWPQGGEQSAAERDPPGAPGRRRDRAHGDLRAAAAPPPARIVCTRPSRSATGRAGRHRADRRDQCG